MEHVFQAIQTSEDLVHAETNAKASKTGFYAVSVGVVYMNPD